VVEVGDAAPGFELPGIAAQPPGTILATDVYDRPPEVRLSDYRHHVVLVNFWATWCPPCVEEAPSLEKFAEQMRNQGVSVIGVSVDQDTDALARFVAEHHVSFPIARDPNQALASRYGTFKFPETYILDLHGRVAEKIVGPIDWQDPRIVDYVRALAAPAARAAR
jgi:cytochrome c biogenesis protein CcmG/thiol:disulfide interchange protein DsbE